jgi:hypothetical protein
METRRPPDPQSREIKPGNTRGPPAHHPQSWKMDPRATEMRSAGRMVSTIARVAFRALLMRTNRMMGGILPRKIRMGRLTIRMPQVTTWAITKLTR